MLRKLAFTAAIVSALWMGSAAALGLGDIDVKSQLNQKFFAVIPLTSTTADEGESMLVNLASNEEFERAGIERSEYVSSLNFVVKMDGQPRIEISSMQIAREPFIAFLIDVRGLRSRLLREYTVLLDPPSAPAPKPAPPATTGAGAQFYETPGEAAPSARAPSVEMERPAPSAEPVTPPAPSSSPAAPNGGGAGADGMYGPIRERETLWSIANKLRADPSIGTDQVLVAIYKANPQAFVGGINGLVRGAMLRVPTAEEQRALSPAAAKARYAELRGVPAPRPESRPPAAPLTSAPPPPPAAVVDTPPVERPSRRPPRPEAPVVAPVAPVPATPVAPPPPPPPAKQVEPPASVAPPPPAPAESSAVPTPDTVTQPPPAATETPPAPAEAVSPADATTPPGGDSLPPPADETPNLPPRPAIVVEPADAGEGDGLPLVAIAIALLLLLAAVAASVWYYRKRQQNAFAPPLPTPSPTPRPAAEPVSGVTVARAAPASSVRSELEQLESSLAADTSVFDAPQARTQAGIDNTLAMTAQMPAVDAADAYRPDPNATQVIEPAVASTARMAEKVDFDVTGQFESDTVSINLDTNDPVAEADFHLAYGLYDEAALLLIQAAEKEPANTAIRVKLAEVYFAAGKADEFQQTAEALKPELPPGEWQKLAILGQQLCPDAAIFQDIGAGDLGDAVDLSFDEPAAGTSAASPMLDLPSFDEPAKPAAGGDSLDFKLDDFQLPDTPAAKAAAKAETPGSGEVLEFNLDVPEIKVEQPAASSKLELDLADFDLSTPDVVSPAAKKPAANGAELRLEDFDVAADSASISSGDAAGTKLDLARAYLDMGDKDMAKSLLDEVMAQGNGQQKQEAQALMGRLG